jgi:hypothetical protein
LYIYNNLNIIKNLNLNFNRKIYIPFFFDFRGRLYYNSLIGPTNLKYIRYAIHYGEYTKEEINNIDENN